MEENNSEVLAIIKEKKDRQKDRNKEKGISHVPKSQSGEKPTVNHKIHNGLLCEGENFWAMPWNLDVNLLQ